MPVDSAERPSRVAVVVIYHIWKKLGFKFNQNLFDEQKNQNPLLRLKVHIHSNHTHKKQNNSDHGQMERSMSAGLYFQLVSFNLHPAGQVTCRHALVELNLNVLGWVDVLVLIPIASISFEAGVLHGCPLKSRQPHRCAPCHADMRRLWWLGI